MTSSSLLGLLLFAPPAAAPAPAPTSTPTPAPRRPPVISPDVGDDRRVTFRLRAPDARAVSVSGGFTKEKVVLTRDGDGLWSATVGPVEPGVHEYSFTVDGLKMIDPANGLVKPMRAPTTSILEVPGSPPLLTEFQASVPHGTVHVHQYLSKALGGRLRRLHVYTPPGYEQQRGRYPALFLLHGSGDNDACWTVHGRAHHILDNLIAQGKAKPMVVVMPDGHAVPPERPGPPESRPENTQSFERDLLEEILPLVTARYRLRADAAGRAIAGLSMGGNQALAVGLGHPDRFAWIGGFSSSPPPREVLDRVLGDPKALNKKVRWLWIGCGKEDFLLERNRTLITLLEEKGVKHTWQLTEGGHAWPVWRQYLGEVLPQLFR